MTSIPTDEELNRAGRWIALEDPNGDAPVSVAAVAQLIAEVRSEGQAIVGELAELVIWMSGSADFSPEGQAGKAWAEKGLPTLRKALAYAGPRPPRASSGEGGNAK